MHWLFSFLLFLFLVRQVDGQATISTLVGIGINQISSDGGPAVEASLANPTGVAVDSSGNLYISEQTGARVRKVTSGLIATLAGTTTASYNGDGVAATSNLNRPNELAVDTSGTPSIILSLFVFFLLFAGILRQCICR